MNNLLRIDSFKNLDFKRTVLKNSFRLRKYNSTIFDLQKVESTKTKPRKTIRNYLMIPKKDYGIKIH